MALVVVSVLVLMPFVLVHGAARDLVADDAGRIAVRMVVRLAIGYGYLGLAEFARKNLLQVELAADG